MRCRLAKGLSFVLVLVFVFVGAVAAYGASRIYAGYQAKGEQQKIAVAAEQALGQLRAKGSQWNDAFRLATSTPRIGLPGPIAKLQSIKQEVDSMVIPACLAPQRRDLSTGMSEGIDMMLSFMENRLRESAQVEYSEERTKAMTRHFDDFSTGPMNCPNASKK